ncbi:hypothetical protein PHYSODRAFT_562329 [Phytophthora sojae]|uniref:Uncharacterized protein n=1 Tax=Phytophthora sojae (strain P6497) TaxID=1094619 RepID=G4ZRC7_PHYSP|nr:hypothetical protein PHYSODRAFT_562329 [Phytophthora sojae]EGZ13812.1 hypothetical protein PHYSODRAFT_562329 [Phytophthora sojae]|eukprot:XP_009531241.1 hypothetical protein PHYSODRAFT_562329 [Phytophthora sojae]
MIARSLDSEPDIGQLINDFPQDGTDEAFDRFLRTHHSKKLRAACTQLGLHPQADPSTNHKDGYIELLIQYRRARLRGEVFSGNFRTKAKQKKKMGTFDVEGRTKHCGFRLANVLFSPTFFRRMVESGALPSTGVEVEPVDGRTKFWREVAVAYASENPQFDVVVGQIARYEGIDPRLAPHHSSAKLCAMWKDLTTRYEESLARWKQLGTDTVGLAHFCGDYLDGLYLHDWLQLRPIAVDPEQARASKRARTGNTIQQANENSSVGPPAEEQQVPAQRQSPRTLEERLLHVLDANSERRQVNKYDGVIYSSQAVRDTMSAIEALKRGGFDRTVIAQAEECMDAIVQVWLRELDNAGKRGADS